mmetsp:Transcript_19859/g.46441  ORF Transcript_19859/g.46441 Transcript_19859/m.46441 type:complete len:700 (+) Transcript_19859:111-2210(+)
MTRQSERWRQMQSFALESSRLMELQMTLLQTYLSQQVASDSQLMEAAQNVEDAVEQVCETIQGLQLKLATEAFKASIPTQVHSRNGIQELALDDKEDMSISNLACSSRDVASAAPASSIGSPAEIPLESRYSAAQDSIASMADSVQSIQTDDPLANSAICPFGVLSPHWGGKLAWDFLVMFLVLMDATVLPFQLTFKGNVEEDSFDAVWLLLTTMIFGIDVVLSFNTAIEASEKDVHIAPGTLITSRIVIAKKYVRGWFAIDCGSTIPWSQIAEAITAGEGSSSQLTRLTKVVKFVRLLRLMRMLRLAKLGAIWERIEAKIGSIFFVQCVALIRVLLVVIGICHWNACIFWLIGLPSNLFTELMTDRARTEYADSPHWTTVWRLTEAQAEPWRWVDRPMTESYVFCFYWTLGVMRTMPAEVTPVNLPERLFVLVFMFFALSAFAICVSLITQAFFKIWDRRRIFNEELAAVRMHLQKTHVEETVQLKVKAYLRYIFERRRIHAKEAGLMNYLPEQLKGQIRRSQVRMYMERIPLMRELERDSIEKICDNAETYDLMQGDAVNTAGNVAEAAWVLVSGRLRVTKRLVGPMESDTTNLHTFAPVTVDEHCLDEEGPVLSRCTTLAAESSELIRIGKAMFFESISANRRKSLTLRGTALYHVQQTTSNLSNPTSPSGKGGGRRGSILTVSHAVQAAAVISSS